jgi:hypothetical protein
MIQASVAAPVQSRLQPETQENDLLDPLCRLAGDLQQAHALIAAEHGLDLMCGLIRCGCLAATVLRPGDKPDADDYDVVFVPQVAAFPSFDHVIRLARRSLGSKGRLIAGVRDGRAAVALARRLRLNGFSVQHSSTRLPGLMLLRADLRRHS